VGEAKEHIHFNRSPIQRIVAEVWSTQPRVESGTTRADVDHQNRRLKQLLLRLVAWEHWKAQPVPQPPRGNLIQNNNRAFGMLSARLGRAGLLPNAW